MQRQSTENIFLGAVSFLRLCLDLGFASPTLLPAHLLPSWAGLKVPASWMDLPYARLSCFAVLGQTHPHADFVHAS